MRCKICKKEINIIHSLINGLTFSKDMIVSKGHICEIDKEYFDGDIGGIRVKCNCGDRLISIQKTDQARLLLKQRNVFSLLNDFKLGLFCDTIEIIDTDEDYDS